jgi:hypothetical protein
MKTRMRQMGLSAVVAVALVVGLAGPILAAQSGYSDAGTWNLNVAKSTFSAGTSSLRITLKSEAAGVGVKNTIDSLSGNGTVRHWEYTANYDGKDAPIVGSSSLGDVVALTRVDANTVRSIFKKGGKVTVTMTSVVSSDGKTMTMTGTGTNALGQASNNVYFDDKQAFVGTWKARAPKPAVGAETASATNVRGVTLKIEAVGLGFKTMVDVRNADGTTRHWETLGDFDGKDTPIIGTTANGDMVARTRLDANTVRSVFKKNGAVTVTQNGVISEDGKVLTFTTTGTNSAGKAVNTTVIYDKQ